jgi:regulator of protease activity HflC (stomatin/prohibitin superfamily)
MRIERQAEANRLRAEGAKEAQAIRDKTHVETQEILRKGREEAARITAEAERRAAELLAEAHQKNPEFYQFWSSLQASKRVLKEKATLILSSDQLFFGGLDPSATKSLRMIRVSQAMLKSKLQSDGARSDPPPQRWTDKARSEDQTP